MIKRIPFSAIILLMVLLFPIARPVAQDKASTLNAKLLQMVKSLENNLTVSLPASEKMTVVLKGFVYNEDGLEATSPFADLLSKEIESLMGTSETFKILPREQVRKIVRSRDWKIERTTPTIPENLGAMAGAEAVLSGKFEDFGDKVKVSVLVHDVKTRNIISDASALIRKEDLPGSVSLYSENHDQVDFVDMVDPAEPSGDGINLDVFVNHSPDAVYREGDVLQIYVQADRDCYIRILYRDSEGDDVILFPSSEEEDDFIRANQTVEIPPPDTYRIVAVKPYGTECLKVFASTEPFGAFDSVEIVKIRQRGMRIERDQSVSAAEEKPAAQAKQEPAYGEKSITVRVAE